MGVTEQLARFVTETDLSQIPESVIAAAKLRMLDTIAVMTAGSQFEPARIAVGFVEELGTNPEAGIIGSRIRAVSPYAAFANGVAAHSPEYDDRWAGSNLVGANHISACVLPSAMAVAEARRASGADMLLAYILGYEVGARLGLASSPQLWGGIRLGYHPTPLLAVFGAGMTVVKLLGLDVEQARYTMGLIGSEGGGLRKQAGTMGKAFQAGHAARNGVVAALLAARGMTADGDVFEGVPGTGHDHFGYFETHFREGNYNLEPVARTLGSQWELMYTITRLHPGYTLAASVDLTLAMVREQDIRPEQVEGVEVGVTSLVNLGPTYRYPSGGLHSRFSQWYNIAVCILDRKAGLMQFTDELASSPDVGALMEKVHFYVDPECEEDYRSGKDPMGSGCQITFSLKDGRKIHRKERSRPGYVDNPATWVDIMEKFRDCAEYSGLSNQELSVDRVAGLVDRIDQLSKAEELMKALAA